MIDTKEASGPRIVLLGGGHGTSAMVEGLLPHLPEADITAVVNMCDNGSATGKVREMFGGVAVGDLRRVLVAAGSNQVGPLFDHRFGPTSSLSDIRHLSQKTRAAVPAAYHARVQQILDQTMVVARQIHDQTTLAGHTFGNLVLTALRLDRADDVTCAAQEVGLWLEAGARVLPATNQPHDLVMRDGAQTIVGEGPIDDYATSNPQAVHVWLDPLPVLSPEAYAAIAAADVVVIGPGSLFTSLLPVVAVRGVGDAIGAMQQRGGSYVLVGNLAQERNATTGLRLVDYALKLERQTGRRFDHIIHNIDTQALPAEAIPVLHDDQHFREFDPRTIGVNLVAATDVLMDPNDPIVQLRSTVRHDTRAVAGALREHVLATNSSDPAPKVASILQLATSSGN